MPARIVHLDASQIGLGDWRRSTATREKELKSCRVQLQQDKFQAAKGREKRKEVLADEGEKHAKRELLVQEYLPTYIHERRVVCARRGYRSNTGHGM